MNMRENKDYHHSKRDSQIITTTDITVIQSKLANCHSNSTVFLDVDDTIITPASKIFRSTSLFRNHIDELKKNKKELPHFEKILAVWRQNRRSILVSEAWPEMIQALHQKGVTTYALTQMASGKLGPMNSVEEWRYQELLSKGIQFSPLFKQEDQYTLIPSIQKNEIPQNFAFTDPNPTPNSTRHSNLQSNLETYYNASPDMLDSPALFYRGIFMTGPFSKGQVIKSYFEETKPQTVLFVDDREHQVLDVAKACKEQGVSFIGIIYRGADLISGSPDPEIVNFQIKSLMEEFKWLEDEEAEQKFTQK